MEILKNFFVGLAVILLALLLTGVAFLFLPFILVAGSLVLITLKVVIFVVACVLLVILVGYLVRKGLSKDSLRKPDGPAGNGDAVGKRDAGAPGGEQRDHQSPQP